MKKSSLTVQQWFYVILIFSVIAILGSAADSLSRLKTKDILNHYQLIIVYVAPVLIVILLFYVAKIKIQTYIAKQKAKKNNTRDKNNQLRFISNENIRLYKQNPINSKAFSVFAIVEDFLQQSYKGYRIIAETTLGSFIRVSEYSGTKQEQKQAQASFNSKRLDFLIIDPKGKPAIAIEYHGNGHYINEDTEKRDEVKRKTLELVDIKLLEIPEVYKKEYLLNTLNSYLKKYKC